MKMTCVPGKHGRKVLYVNRLMGQCDSFPPLFFGGLSFSLSLAQTSLLLLLANLPRSLSSLCPLYTVPSSLSAGREKAVQARVRHKKMSLQASTLFISALALLPLLSPRWWWCVRPTPWHPQRRSTAPSQLCSRWEPFVLRSVWWCLVPGG